MYTVSQRCGTLPALGIWPYSLNVSLSIAWTTWCLRKREKQWHMSRSKLYVASGRDRLIQLLVLLVGAYSSELRSLLRTFQGNSPTSFGRQGNV